MDVLLVTCFVTMSEPTGSLLTVAQPLSFDGLVSVPEVVATATTAQFSQGPAPVTFVVMVIGGKARLSEIEATGSVHFIVPGPTTGSVTQVQGALAVMTIMPFWTVSVTGDRK